MSRIPRQPPPSSPSGVGDAKKARSTSSEDLSVNQGETPPRRFLYPLKGAATPPARVSQELAAPPNAPPAARYSGALLKSLMAPRMKMPQVLETLYAASSDSGLVKDLSERYQKDISLAQDQFLDQLDNETLVQLHNRLNTQELLRLRAAGLYAARKPINGLSADPQKNTFFSDQVMNMGIRLNLLEMGIRERLDKAGYTFTTKEIPLYTKQKDIPKSLQRLLFGFFGEQDKKVSAGQGDMKERLALEWGETVSSDYQHTRAAPVDPTKNPDSQEELAVCEIFLSDFYRNTFSFEDAHEGKTAQHVVPSRGRLHTDPALRKEISDMMLNYCGGDRTQAVRLSMALSQTALMGPTKEFAVVAQGRDNLLTTPVPENDGVLLTTGDTLERRAFSVKRRENGDVRVHLGQRLPFNSAFGLGAGSPLYLVDKKASAVVYDMEGVIPKTPETGEEKPSVLESAEYKYVMSLESLTPASSFPKDGYNDRPY